METKHTKGEWINDRGILRDSNKNTIRSTTAMTHTQAYDVEATANALLITAAPDLLKTLMDFVNTCDNCSPVSLIL